MNEFEELATEKSKEKHKREKKLKKEKKTKREREEDDGADGEDERRKKRKEKKRDKNDDDKKTNNNDKKNGEMHTLFFGQMPFDTKAKDIAPWLKANLNRQGCGRDVGQIPEWLEATAKGRRGSRKSLKGLRSWILPPRKRRRKR